VSSSQYGLPLLDGCASEAKSIIQQFIVIFDIFRPAFEMV
jgi:hypothetical protein